MNSLLKVTKTLNCANNLRRYISVNKAFSSVAEISDNKQIKISADETYKHVIQKDFNYFLDLSNTKGIHHTIQVLENESAKVDASTKFGREIIKAKNEILTRLVYQNRTAEE